MVGLGHALRSWQIKVLGNALLSLVPVPWIYHISGHLPEDYLNWGVEAYFSVNKNVFSVSDHLWIFPFFLEHCMVQESLIR